MSRKEEILSEFFSSEITVSLSKRKLQQLRDLLQDAVQNQEDRLQDAVKTQEDRCLLWYLDWVLSQQD